MIIAPFSVVDVFSAPAAEKSDTDTNNKRNYTDHSTDDCSCRRRLALKSTKLIEATL